METHVDKTLLQQSMLTLMKRFDCICRRHDIHYSLHGGTLLGAIRERGFIPWDDDIDITLTRVEFEKFKSCLSHKETDVILKEDIALRPMLWARTDATAIPVWIDLFIYDYITESPVGQKLKTLGLTIFLGMTKTKDTMRIAKKGEYRGIKYIAILCCYLLGKLFSMKRKVSLANWFAENRLVGKQQLIQRSNDQFKALSILLPASCMSEYQYVLFEDTEMMISKHYHEILSTSYGSDYMIPKPPTLAEINAHNEYRRLGS